MNRILLVTLLQKNIQELELITQGFMEMTEYPMPIIVLAQRKTEDIQAYIEKLALLKDEVKADVSIVEAENDTESPQTEEFRAKNITESTIDTVAEEKIEQPNTIESIKELIADTISVEQEPVIVAEAVAEAMPESENKEKSTTNEVTANETLEEETVDQETVVEEMEEEIQIAVIETAERETEISTPEPPVIEQLEPRKTILGERSMTAVHTRNETLSHTDNSISATLANKKITDIKQAISIGDRFRFQRELFRGNGEDMNKTLTYINQLATLEEVLSFLKSKYGWQQNNEAAEDFFQIVKRRFV